MKKNILRQLIMLSKRLMYVFLIQLFFCTILLANDGNAQRKTIEEVRVSLNLEEKTLLQFFKQVEARTDFKFTYNDDLVDLGQRITVEENNQSLYKVLEVAARQTKLNFIQVNENIHVEATPAKGEGQTVDMVEQDVIVSGVVTDKSGEPIPGATVSVQGTTTGTATDLDGRYSLSVPEGSTLVFSFIGFETQSIAIGGRSVIDVALAEDMASLDEVVVVGYGEQKKVNIIGSIATVSSEELSATLVPNISNAMAGRMPGVLVQQRSGEPGSNAASILIRGKSTLGNNAPLVVIDGIQGRDLNSVNIADVESISVLKDAAAAIYGARAANGVILVTTKSGKIDTAPIFNYSFYEGFQQPTQLPELANSWEYAEMLREVETYRGIDPSNMTFSLEDIQKFKSGEYPWTHPNTDWYKEALAKNSRIRNHNISVTGGTSTLKYYTSLGTMKEEGIYKHSNNNFNRVNLKGRIDMEINKYLTLGLDVNGSIENRESSVKSATNIFTSVIRNYPYKHAVFPGTNLPGPDIEYGDQPVVTPSSEPGFDDDQKFRSNNTLFATFKIPGLEALQIDASYSYDKYFRKQKFFEKPYVLYDFDVAGYLSAGNTGSENGEEFLIPYRAGTVAEPRLNDLYEDSHDKSLNLRMNYQNTFLDKHNVSGFVAYENAQFESQGISAFRRYFNSDKLPFLFAGGDAQKDNDGWASNDSRVNFISRLNYNYDETYLLQIGFRRDGSVRFSKESGRWGNFPSVLLGWRISEHSWWEQSVGFIDEIKLKGSWAKMGNDLVPAFQYLSSYSFGAGYVTGADFAYSPALYQSGTPNPLITWEVANIFNVGFESYLFNNSLSFDVDFFKERRSNILVKRNASVPQFTGLTLPDENFGIVDNQGVELMLGYRGEFSGFSYNLNSSFSFVRNKVVEFDEPERSVPWQVRTGKPQGSELLYESIGVFRDEEHVQSVPHVPGARPGDLIIKDVDGDGQITPDDRTLLPFTPDPEIMFSLSGDLSYQNFRLSFLIQGVENAARNAYSFVNQGTSGNYFRYDALGRWTPENINASKPRPFDRVEEYWRQNYLTDYNFHELGYARLKNVQLSYSLPQRLTQRMRIGHSEIFVSGQNLILIYSKSKIFDPEVQNSQTYPLMSVVSLGGNFSF